MDSIHHILEEIWESKDLRWSRKLKITANKRDRSKYYEFHKDHDHNIGHSIALKNEIEGLIRRGKLSKYVDCNS